MWNVGYQAGSSLAFTTKPGTQLATSVVMPIWVTAIREYSKTQLNPDATKSNPGLLYNKGFSLLHDYGNTWENMPTGFAYGHVLNLGCSVGSLDTQLAFGYDANRSAYIRTADIQSSSIDATLGIPGAWKNSSDNYGWKRIAWAEEVLLLNGNNTMQSVINSIGDSNGTLLQYKTSDHTWSLIGVAKANAAGNSLWGGVPVGSVGVGTTFSSLYLRSSDEIKYYRKNSSGNWNTYTSLDTGNYTTTLDKTYVKKSGDTMSGQLRIDTGKQNFSDLSKLNDEAALLLGKNQDTINGIAFARQDIQAIISTQSNPNTTTLKLNPLGGKVQVGPANTTTTVGISSSTITYNKTTGCLEIMA